MTPTPTPTSTPVSPLPTPFPLPPEIADVAVHTITDADFVQEWSEAEKLAHWERGLPVPATITVSQHLIGVAAPGVRFNKPGLLAPIPSSLAQAPVTGWTSLYSEGFDGVFPSPGQNGACALQLPTNNSNYQWGRDTFRRYNNTAGAAWPAKGGTGGQALHPGTDTYPDNLDTRLLCEFTNLTQAKNLMAEFALWLDRADTGDFFFFGFNTGERDANNDLVFRGRRWASTPVDGQGQVQWEVNRVFYPGVGAKAAQNSGKVRMIWVFVNDGNRHTNAQGAWLDALTVEQYQQPASTMNCQNTIDPTIAVPGVPGNIGVSKGLNLPPYADDFKSGAVNEIDAMIGRLKQSGVNWVRLEFIAVPSQFTPINANSPAANNRLNHLDFRHYDQLIDQLCANQIGVLGLMSYQTLLDQRWKGQLTLPADYKAAFTDIISQTVRYYDNRIRYWEVWNEPDYDETRLQPSAYAELLIATHDTIKVVESGDKVVYGGLGSADSNADSYHDVVYLELSIQGRTNPGPFDIFALHPYPSKLYIPNQLPLDPGVYMPLYQGFGPTILHKFMYRMGQNGDVDKPIWITEIGWNGAKVLGSDATKQCAAINETLVSREEQAIYLTNGLNVLFQETAWDWESVSPSVPAVTKVFWYQYRDTGTEKNCNPTVGVADAGLSPSWDVSYVARRVFPSAANTVVDWWFGLYNGATPPQPNLVECTFSRYPAADAVRVCLNLTQTLFLPIIQADTVTASGGQ